MKRIYVINDKVDVVELNITADASNTHPFVVADDVEVFGGYTSNGDGTFTAPPPPPITRADVNEERERRKFLPLSAVILGDVIEGFANGDPDVVIPGGLTINMDMRNDADRVNLLGLTLTGSLLVGSASAETKNVYTADDKIYRLTGAQLIQLGTQAGGHDGYVYDKARIIKAMDPIPADYATNEAYWAG